MNRIRLALATAALGGLMSASAAIGDPMIVEDFNDGASPNWAFFTDQVMGGVSTGQAGLDSDGGQSFLRLQGEVSTANNGGFIQARLKLSERVPEAAQGIEMEVRGNGQTYFVHLRTRGTVLPWQYYQASFEVTGDWTKVKIPFSAFKPQGRALRAAIAPGSIQSLAVVAYGRDHAADVSVTLISYY
jgi:hypothetical protein